MATKIVEIVDDSDVFTGNTLDQNPNNLTEGGKYIIGRNIVNSEGAIIGTIKTKEEAAAEAAAAAEKATADKAAEAAAKLAAEKAAAELLNKPK